MTHSKVGAAAARIGALCLALCLSLCLAGTAGAYEESFGSSTRENVRVFTSDSVWFSAMQQAVRLTQQKGNTAGKYSTLAGMYLKTVQGRDIQYVRVEPLKEMYALATALELDYLLLAAGVDKIVVPEIRAQIAAEVRTHEQCRQDIVSPDLLADRIAEMVGLSGSEKQSLDKRLFSFYSNILFTE
ncbi:MAG: hypothetical protein Q4F72_04495 [Desulfovibrionaceae bacterium]|nr:hypothetical protein [Desulfovibrionaceae bacterium]